MLCYFVLLFLEVLLFIICLTPFVQLRCKLQCLERWPLHAAIFGEVRLRLFLWKWGKSCLGSRHGDSALQSSSFCFKFLTQSKFQVSHTTLDVAWSTSSGTEFNSAAESSNALHTWSGPSDLKMGSPWATEERSECVLSDRLNIWLHCTWARLSACFFM